MTTEITVNPFAAPAPVASRGATPATAAVESSRAVAEVQAALAIARMNPRDQRAAMDRILNACTRQTLAQAAVYSYSRGGSEVTGPSIRLAEAVAQQWGNMQFGIRELSNAGGKSEVQAFAWDVETNTRREVTFSVPHIRHTRKGSFKLEDPRDIYELIANQGSRRLRACILAVIPGDVIEAAVSQCQITLRANVDVTPEGIKKLIDAFSQFGVTKAQIEKFCQCHVEAIRPAQIVRLRTIYTSLKDGMAEPADFFEPESAPAAPAIEKPAEKQTLKERLKAQKVAETTEIADADTPDAGAEPAPAPAPEAPAAEGEEIGLLAMEAKVNACENLRDLYALFDTLSVAQKADESLKAVFVHRREEIQKAEATAQAAT